MTTASRFGSLAMGVATIALGACRTPAPSLSDDLAQPSATAPSSARRPARTYLLRRTEDRCELEVIEAGRGRGATPTLCPANLEVGERIRITGQTCMRDSRAGLDREQPTVCPTALVDLEVETRRASP